MEYTVKALADLAGVSGRTLRYYDQRGLLKPSGYNSGGYRLYTRVEVERLRQILFYRELGLELSEIAKILDDASFDSAAALESHLTALKVKRAQIDALIKNVSQSIREQKGEITMTDAEKFEGFKDKMIAENEQKYGNEIRGKYGDEVVSAANAKVKGMTKADQTELEQLTEELNTALKAAVRQGDPAGELAVKACELHKRWLCFFWAEYTPEAHMGVAQMYVDDPRFAAHYDGIAPGLAVFLRDAICAYCTPGVC
ncbi:MAG: MerR family transcriptional regulator [Oscillospiraceae bacterium]|nr:MerR family transcriptional regulator [Oscillospiraceae bacterium]